MTKSVSQCYSKAIEVLKRKSVLYQLPLLQIYFHNAGIWPYVSGLYVLALIKTGKRKKAIEELEKLAEANKIGQAQKWEFNEWLHSKTGKPMGVVLQSWNAAGYIIAYQTVVKGKLLF